MGTASCACNCNGFATSTRSTTQPTTEATSPPLKPLLACARALIGSDAAASKLGVKRGDLARGESVVEQHEVGQRAVVKPEGRAERGPDMGGG